MNPFNLEHALAGYPVVTRNGLKIQAIHNFKNELFNILGVIVEGEIYKYSIEGRLINTYEIPTEPFDLFMAPTKNKGWINVYKSINGENSVGLIYSSPEDAIKNIPELEEQWRVRTIEIEWDEWDE